MRQYFLYILASKRNRTLYVGVTNDLERRVCEHRHGVVEGFTKKLEFPRNHGHAKYNRSKGV